MTKTINFDERITILVGINGSGKTSVLNLLNWLLSSNVEELCLIEFEEVVLNFNFKQCDFKLLCNQDSATLSLLLTNLTENTTFQPIRAKFHLHPRNLTKDKGKRESTRRHYQGLEPDKDELAAWNFLVNEIPSPTVIGLDRNLYDRQGNQLKAQEILSYGGQIRQFEKLQGATPINKIKDELLKNYNIYRNNVIDLNASINRKIVLSAFDNFVRSQEDLDNLLSETKPTVQDIERLRKQIIDFLRENQTITVRSSKESKMRLEVDRVNNYFSNLKSVVKANEYDLLYYINLTQLKKINELLVEFRQYENATARLYKPLSEFLSTVNKFFEDSGKELYFDKVTSQVYFRILNSHGLVNSNRRDINDLSSGEKQILILLTYIKYNENLNIFLIDEPELSLHPKWQVEFLDAIKKIMPKNAQLIMATHSPEIVGQHEDLCEVLLPYNDK